MTNLTCQCTNVETETLVGLFKYINRQKQAFTGFLLNYNPYLLRKVKPSHAKNDAHRHE